MPELDSALVGILFQAKARPEGHWVHVEAMAARRRREQWWAVLEGVAFLGVVVVAIWMLASLAGVPFLPK